MAGGIVDGQLVDQANTNPAFIFKNADDTTLYKLTLNRSGSGTIVNDIQKSINDLKTYTGQVANTGGVPPWATNNFGPNTDNVLQRINEIDAAYDPSSGALLHRSNIVSISNGASSVSVTFSTAFNNATYTVECSIECNDSTPIFLQWIIQNKTSSGFDVIFNAPTDSANYKLNYIARKPA